MNKNEIMFNMRFKDVCDTYGFDSENFEVIGNGIVIFTPNKFGCAVLDEKYNIVYLGVNFVDSSKAISPEAYVNAVIQHYSVEVPDKYLTFNFKRLMELSSRVEVEDDGLYINGVLVDSKSDEDSKDLLLVSKFFEKEIRKFNINGYHMLCVGIHPTIDMFCYSNIIMNDILSYLYECIETNKVPNTSELLSRLGMANLDNDVDVLGLESTIKVLLRRYGYEIQDNSLVKTEKEYSLGKLASLHKRFVEEEYVGYGIVRLDKNDEMKPKLIVK